MAFQYTNDYCNYTQITPSCTQICADHTTTTKPQWETLSMMPPCHPLHCLAFHPWWWGWDAGATGCPVPVATLQPNTKLCPVTPAPGPESIFSPFFLSTRRHPTKKGTLAVKRFLFMACPELAAFINLPSVSGCSLSGCRFRRTPSKSQISISPAQRKYLAAKWVEDKRLLCYSPDLLT